MDGNGDGWQQWTAMVMRMDGNGNGCTENNSNNDEQQ